MTKQPGNQLNRNTTSQQLKNERIAPCVGTKIYSSFRVYRQQDHRPLLFPRLQGPIIAGIEIVFPRSLNRLQCVQDDWWHHSEDGLPSLRGAQEYAVTVQVRLLQVGYVTNAERGVSQDEQKRRDLGTEPVGIDFLDRFKDLIDLIIRQALPFVPGVGLDSGQSLGWI